MKADPVAEGVFDEQDETRRENALAGDAIWQQGWKSGWNSSLDEAVSRGMAIYHNEANDIQDRRAIRAFVDAIKNLKR